jgi:hypothetical protein
MNANPNPNPAVRSAFSSLRRYAVRKTPMEKCELCGKEIAPQHRHLLETAVRRIVCSCDHCALRFHDVVGGRYQLVPRDTCLLKDFQMTDAQWDDLSLPINLAFFFFSTAQSRVTAMYPGPAGVTESLLALSSWETLAEANPELAHLKPDVEALLVNRVGTTREYFLAPIDVCFELVGLIRQHWRGLSGGNEVWRELDRFFARLRGEVPVEPEGEVHA